MTMMKAATGRTNGNSEQSGVGTDRAGDREGKDTRNFFQEPTALGTHTGPYYGGIQHFFNFLFISFAFDVWINEE